LLPPAVALYAASLVVLVHRGSLALWSVPLLAVGLLLVYEAGDVRYRLPPGAAIEAGPLRALIRRVALTAAIGLLASASVVAAAGVSSRGGAAAAVVGGLAVAAALLLVRSLAAA
jgi:multidrug efflux pump subunit AcrB